MDKEKLKQAFDAGYDYRSSLDQDVIDNFGEGSQPSFEQWYTEQKLNKHGVVRGGDKIRGKATCPDCGDRGWLYDNDGRRTGTCPCHY
jgi:hypothetical protein